MCRQPKADERLVYNVPDSDTGKTVRDILKKYFGFSSKALTALKRDENGIVLNGVRVTVRAPVKDGDTLVLNLAADDKNMGVSAEPVRLPLSIVYEDADVLVADKPPYMPTHPSHGHCDDTLANAVAFYFMNDNADDALKSDAGSTGCFVFRSVNRLDRNTSGLVCVAKHRYAASVMSSFMSDGLIKKKYIAITNGIPEDDCGVIDTYIKRERESIITRPVCDADSPGAARALTHYSVIGKSADGKYAEVLLEPQTGRTHQLRVHLAYIGTPIFGDELYGSAGQPYIGRHALHACGLSFPKVRINDAEGKRDIVVLSSELPEDMKSLERALNIKLTVKK